MERRGFLYGDTEVSPPEEMGRKSERRTRKELIGGGNFFRGAGPEGCGVEDDLKSRWKAFNGT